LNKISQDADLFGAQWHRTFCIAFPLKKIIALLKENGGSDDIIAVK